VIGAKSENTEMTLIQILFIMVFNHIAP
jgi:hypothetical protein